MLNKLGGKSQIADLNSPQVAKQSVNTVKEQKIIERQAVESSGSRKKTSGRKAKDKVRFSREAAGGKKSAGIIDK